MRCVNLTYMVDFDLTWWSNSHLEPHCSRWTQSS